MKLVRRIRELFAPASCYTTCMCIEEKAKLGSSCMQMLSNQPVSHCYLYSCNLPFI